MCFMAMLVVFREGKRDTCVRAIPKAAAANNREGVLNSACVHLCVMYMGRKALPMHQE